MAGTGPTRGADGRFVAREATCTSARSRRGVGQLALLTPAIIFGLLGFAFPVCWVGALVLMGILWGAIAVTRQAATGGKGVLGEVVDVVVHEAKDVADSATHPTETEAS